MENNRLYVRGFLASGLARMLSQAEHPTPTRLREPLQYAIVNNNFHIFDERGKEFKGKIKFQERIEESKTNATRPPEVGEAQVSTALGVLYSRHLLGAGSGRPGSFAPAGAFGFFATDCAPDVTGLIGIPAAASPATASTFYTAMVVAAGAVGLTASSRFTTAGRGSISRVS
jgi:hypothetical protein